MLTNLPSLLPELTQLARAAGKKIVEIYDQHATPLTVTYKDDHSPLTQADMAAHHLIMKGLAQYPWPILSEEAADISFRERAKWETYWLVDPLDGTKEFISRTGDFTVNIALIHQQKAILGVIDVPTQQTTYTAAKGHGAYKQIADDSPQAISTCPWQEKIRIIMSRHHSPERLTELLKAFKEYDLMYAGSSLKSCLVAEGKADLYLRPGKTSEWDTAAAQCIVEEAGGLLRDPQNHPLRYNTKDSLINPCFFVAGDPTIAWMNYLRFTV